MKSRCTKEPSYLERGIGIAPPWRSYGNFLKDMGERPRDHSLDRIDNAGDYCPENCRWATPEQQNNNRRGVRLIEVNGETLSASQWSRRLGINRKMVTRERVVEEMMKIGIPRH